MMNHKSLFLVGTLFLAACDDVDPTDTPTPDPTNDAGTPTPDAGVDRPDYSCDGVDILLDDSQDGVAQTVVWAFVGNPDEQTLIDTDENLYPPKVVSIKTVCNDTDREVTISFSEELNYSDSSDGDCGSCEISEPSSVTDFYYGFVYDTFNAAEALAESYPAYIGSSQLELSLAPGEGGTLITRLKQYNEGCNSVCERPYPLDETVTTSITVNPN